jgi:hypothetical protein
MRQIGQFMTRNASKTKTRSLWAENIAALRVRYKHPMGIVALADLAYSGAFSETATGPRSISQPDRERDPA